MPITGWLPAYDRTWLSRDVIAGLTVWALVVPESMAYAGIAGVPVQYGLYAVPLAILGYLVFGSSRQLFVGPSATVASISAVAVGTIAVTSGSGGDVVALTGALSIIVGLLYVIGGFVRLGFIARFFAKPVLDGFILGLGLYIAVGQLHKLVGIPSPDGDTISIFVQDIAAIGSWQPTTTLVGAIALGALFVMARLTPRLPGALIVVVIGIAATTLLGLTANGVAVVGSVPGGFSFVPWTNVRPSDIVGLVPGAIAVVIVGFAQSVAIAKAYAAKYGYRVDASQEMIGYGAANLGAGVLQGITVTGSLSKSGAAEEAGGKTPVQFAIVAVLVILTVLFLTGLFTNLPEAVLAAVVIHAVSGMLRPTELVRLRRAEQAEFWLAAGALLGVITIGILAGIVIGVVLSFILLIRQLDHPHAALLGRGPDRSEFRDLATHPDSEPVPGALIYRFEAPLIFANAEIFVDDALARVRIAGQDPPATFIVDMEGATTLDTTGADALRTLGGSLEATGVHLALARATSSVLTVLRVNGVLTAIGEDNVYPTVAAAVAAHEQRRGDDDRAMIDRDALSMPARPRP